MHSIERIQIYEKRTPCHEAANMIDPVLLTKLRKADPETWTRWHWTICILEEVQVPDLNSPISEAWLQHVLQDAIRVRDWSIYQISNPGLPKETYYADIYKHDPDLHFEAFGNSPADALLKAYLQAIEKQ